MASSPASSPRLPSPPPMAEDQTGPISPGPHILDDFSEVNNASSIDQGASRRIRPGARSEDMHEGPPLVDLQEIDSAFQLTEHLKALHASRTESPDSHSSLPVDKDVASFLAQAPLGVDKGIWLYELCRFLTQKVNTMAVGLFADDPPCSAHTCPEMRASEWQYLCAAHDPPKSCCAIDYCCHTLDWSATQLTSSKLFPSRLALGTENVSSAQQLRKMTEIFRRVYRIFAHAWFQHRDVFWRVENKTGLYIFFKTVCDEYRLIPEDNYTIPPEAEGVEQIPTEQRQPSVLRRGQEQPAGNTTTATGNTTKRHRGGLGLSDRQSSVSTIIHEEVEEDEDRWDTEEPEQRGQVKELQPESAVPEEEVEAEEGTAEKVESEEETDEHDPQGSGLAEQQESDQVSASAFQEEHSEAGQEVSTDDEAVVEPMEPKEAAAGDADEATKTVAD